MKWVGFMEMDANDGNCENDGIDANGEIGGICDNL